MPTNPHWFPSMAGTSAPFLCLRILAFNMARIDAIGRSFSPGATWDWQLMLLPDLTLLLVWRALVKVLMVLVKATRSGSSLGLEGFNFKNLFLTGHISKDSSPSLWTFGPALAAPPCKPLLNMPMRSRRWGQLWNFHLPFSWAMMTVFSIDCTHK